MINGYAGRLLWVNLSNKTISIEDLNGSICRQYLGGYGIGAKLLYNRMKGKVDPLGPENIFGIITGPFTGTASISGARFAVVCKSPLTNGWGDANSGGDFGPHLKYSGFDGVFFTGVSSEPVYLCIKDGKAKIKNANNVWGKDSFETADYFEEMYGKEAKTICVGPAGEKLSLISAVMHYRGRAAARSGVGAVMGSKKLKAVVVIGKEKVSVKNQAGINKLWKEYAKTLSPGPTTMFRTYGTCGMTEAAALAGISPIKNWGGIGVRDFTEAGLISDKNVIEKQIKKEGCWHCFFACGGRMEAGSEYSYAKGANKPEYETLAAFGSNCLNNNLESIVMANDICNRYGLDTMSAGATISFAIECYERGILTKKDTDGLKLTWGNHAAIVALTEKMAKREGFGVILADGSKIAAQRIGKGAEEYAIQIGGQEVGYHDPKMEPSLAVSYIIDATPGRHTQGNEGLVPPGVIPEGSYDIGCYDNRGEAHKRASNMFHVINSLGICQLLYVAISHIDGIIDTLNEITGWDTTLEELLETGERIACIRHAFNLREGINPLELNVPDRFIGKPPQEMGPNAGITVDIETMEKDYLRCMDWDFKTCKPSRKKLEQLGLTDIAKDLWG